MSQQPGRIWSKRNGSTLTVSGRRPATAFMPTWLWRCPSNSQTSWPSRRLDDAAARGPARCAGSRPSNMSRRLDEVVVDGDDRVPHLPRLRLGEEEVARQVSQGSSGRRAARAGPWPRTGPGNETWSNGAANRREHLVAHGHATADGLDVPRLTAPPLEHDGAVVRLRDVGADDEHAVVARAAPCARRPAPRRRPARCRPGSPSRRSRRTSAGSPGTIALVWS